MVNQILIIKKAAVTTFKSINWLGNQIKDETKSKPNTAGIKYNVKASGENGNKFNGSDIPLFLINIRKPSANEIKSFKQAI